MSSRKDREAYRQDCLMAVLEYLNAHHDRTAHVYDCEPLGILHVWYASSWKWTWYDPQTLPTEVLEELIGAKHV
jgi:hypothetical protein